MSSSEDRAHDGVVSSSGTNTYDAEGRLLVETYAALGSLAICWTHVYGDNGAFLTTEEHRDNDLIAFTTYNNACLE